MAIDQPTSDVETAVLREITNVTNLPEWMQVHALGRDLRPLAELVAAVALAWFTELLDDEALVEMAAAAIYSGNDEPEWLTTVDGTANAASYEYANRALAAVWAHLGTEVDDA